MEVIETGSATPVGGKRMEAVIYWLAFVSIPVSLVSPGATITLGMVALYGVIIWVKGARYPIDIAAAGRFLCICYLALLAIDIVNGGGLENFASTGADYLHLVAVAPFALALRRVGLDYPIFDRAMQITIAIATVAALTQFFAFSVMRPGGLFLNPIPYGFLLAVWGVVLLSRGLEQGRKGLVSIGFAVAALIPVLLTESKISWACMLLGYAMVAGLWAIEHQRWKTLAASLAVATPVLYLAFYFLAFRRLEPFLEELDLFLGTGEVGADSFGWRYELATSGMRAFWDHPFLGYGLNERMAAIFSHASETGPDITILAHAHNEYVTHLVSYGVLGLVFVLVFVGFLWRVASRCADSAYRRAGRTFTVMLVLYMFFEVAFNMDAISAALSVMVGLLLLKPQGEFRSPA